MPESQLYSYCHPSGRTSQLERFREQLMSGSAPDQYHMKTRNGQLAKKEKTIQPSCIDSLDHLPPSPDTKVWHADRGFNGEVVDRNMFQGQSPKKSRAKESSKHFGVRFRPDLQKWVAEIRVAEWKTVDKKVWLGTFDSEEGAARAVDAARKLLKCKKKRPPNFPCESLAQYSEKIPSNLNLNNLRDESMFKEVTLFVKRKAQEYAASFCPNKTACISISADQVLAKYHSQNLPRQGYGVQDDDVSMEGLISTSHESYNTQLGGFSGDGQWMSPGMMSPASTVTYSSTPSCSSAGTSPEDDKWQYLSYRQEMPQIVEQSVDGDWVHVQTAGIRGGHEADALWEGQNVGNDDQYPLPDNQWNEFLFPSDEEFFEHQVAMDILQRDEMLYSDSQNMQTYNTVDASMTGSMTEWVSQLPLQENFAYSLMNSMEYTPVSIC